NPEQGEDDENDEDEESKTELFHPVHWAAARLCPVGTGGAAGRRDAVTSAAAISITAAVSLSVSNSAAVRHGQERHVPDRPRAGRQRAVQGAAAGASQGAPEGDRRHPGIPDVKELPAARLDP